MTCVVVEVEPGVTVEVTPAEASSRLTRPFLLPLLVILVAALVAGAGFACRKKKAKDADSSG